MTVTERAAKVWAALERHLIERCGLPDGHMLDVNRPYLIRWIGERLKAVPVETSMAAAGPPVRPPLRLDDSAPRQAANTANTATPHLRNLRTGTFHDPRLAAMLERSCSLRGYEQEETVTFDPK